MTRSLADMARDAIPGAAARPPPLARWVDAIGADVIARSWRALWVSRLVVWVSGIAALEIWGKSTRAPAFDPARFTEPFGAVGNVLVAPGARWDAVWYLAIARDGYDVASKAAFFPLYALLVRIGGFVWGSPVVGGILLSTACLFVALVVVHRLTELDLGDEAARWTVIAIAFSPMALFFSALYSESLYLAVSAGAVLAARRGAWPWAGVLGGFAAATRSAGVLVLVALVMLALWGPGPRARARDIAWLALVPLGLVAFLAGLAAGGRDAFEPFGVQEVWFRHFAGPFGGVWDGAVAAWDGARQVVSGSTTHVYFTKAAGDAMAIARQNLALFAWLPLTAVALVGALRRLPLAYAAYVVAALALPLSYPVGPQPLMSLPRFLLVLFPLWMWFGDWLARHPRERWPVLALSAASLAACSAQFTTWHFVV